MGLFTQILHSLWDALCGGPQQEPQTPQQRPPQQYPTHQYQPAPPVVRPPQQQPYQEPRPQYSPPQPKPPQKPSSRPSGPHKVRTIVCDTSHRSERASRQNLNLENQQDGHYQSLRARANDAGSKMAQCFEESHTAYANGDGAHAKELSNQGKAYKAEMERLNAEASEWIFASKYLFIFIAWRDASVVCSNAGADHQSLSLRANREQRGKYMRWICAHIVELTRVLQDSAPGEVDLHGLYVKEAITYSERSINAARRRGDAKIHLIVGTSPLSIVVALHGL